MLPGGGSSSSSGGGGGGRGGGAAAAATAVPPSADTAARALFDGLKSLTVAAVESFHEVRPIACMCVCMCSCMCAHHMVSQHPLHALITARHCHVLRTPSLVLQLTYGSDAFVLADARWPLANGAPAALTIGTSSHDGGLAVTTTGTVSQHTGLSESASVLLVAGACTTVCNVAVHSSSSPLHWHI